MRSIAGARMNERRAWPPKDQCLQEVKRRRQTLKLRELWLRYGHRCSVTAGRPRAIYPQHFVRGKRRSDYSACHRHSSSSGGPRRQSLRGPHPWWTHLPVLHHSLHTGTAECWKSLPTVSFSFPSCWELLKPYACTQDLCWQPGNDTVPATLLALFAASS